MALGLEVDPELDLDMKLDPELDLWLDLDFAVADMSMSLWF